MVLTKIGRTLEEEVSLKKVEERLSRQLLRQGLGQKIQNNLLKLAAPLASKDTLLILDPRRYTEEICQEDAVSGDSA